MMVVGSKVEVRLTHSHFGEGALRPRTANSVWSDSADTIGAWKRMLQAVYRLVCLLRVHVALAVASSIFFLGSNINA